MISKTITYVNFNGIEVTEKLHFHLSVPEMMDVFAELGIISNDKEDSDLTLQEKIEKYLAGSNTLNALKVFKVLLRKSFGVRSADGLRFEKKEEVVNDFLSSEAYNAYFTLLLSDVNEATNFFTSLTPKTEAILSGKAKKK